MNRSFLFAPGNVPRRVEKALGLDADAVILDLEDSVATSDKPATRKPVAEALARPRRCRAYVRVNTPSSAYCYADLVETVRKGLDGIVVPKIESAADLHAIDWLLANLERAIDKGLDEVANLSPGSIPRLSIGRYGGGDGDHAVAREQVRHECDTVDVRVAVRFGEPQALAQVLPYFVAIQ